VRKKDHSLPWQRRMARDDAYGVYFIFKSMEQGPSFRYQRPQIRHQDPKLPDPRPPTQPASRTTTSTSAMRPSAPMVMRVASILSVPDHYYLNGHSFIEQELKRAQIGFSKTDNAFSRRRRRRAASRRRQTQPAQIIRQSSTTGP